MTAALAERSFPSRDDFVDLASSHRLIPVACELVADTLTPVGVFLAAVGEDEGFLLESVEGGERWGRYSFVGRSPLGTIRKLNGEVSVEGPLGALPTEAGILETLRALIEQTSTPLIDGLPPLHSGVVGYLGYDVVREIERLETPPSDDLGLPDACLSVIGELVAFDHWRQRVTLIVNVPIPADASPALLESLYDDAIAALVRLGDDTCRPLVQRPVLAPSPSARLDRAEARPTMAPEQYHRMVEVAKEHVTAGDIFQVVLSQRFDIE